VDQVQRMANQKCSSFAEQSLALMCERSSVLEKTLKNFGHLTLGDYLYRVLKISKDSLQPQKDLIEIVYHYVEPLLGESIAETVAIELDAFPVVLTANHHGADFLAQSVQNSLIFSLRKINDKQARTVPVFACGSIALNNPTYPRGILIYQTDTKSQNFTLPVRLPVFPDKYKKKVVSTVESYDSEMLARIEKRLFLMVRENRIPKSLAVTVKAILDEDYRDPPIMRLPTYSQQAVVLNNRVWKRCFKKSGQSTEMVCLELEYITSQLLQIDLKDEASLAWQILFNPTLRTQVLGQLNQVKACWDQDKLSSRIYPMNRTFDVSSGCGTIFFWALDDDGCRVPLSLIVTSYEVTLQGRNDRGELLTVPFKPQDVIDNLRARRLLPSLFICYSTIGFARGISCCGGYFQADYLSVMQRGIVNALSESGGNTRVIEQISEVPSDIYLSGMQAVTRNLSEDVLLPVGPIELIAGGGLSKKQLESISLLKLYDIHLAGLIESYPDFQRPEERQNDWCLLLAREFSSLLQDRTVMI